MSKRVGKNNELTRLDMKFVKKAYDTAFLILYVFLTGTPLEQPLC